MIHSTQVVIIGAGPGGYTAAFLAADLGLTVTLIDESSRPGGVCLYRGCMPSKALLHAAKVLTDAREAARLGIDFGEPNVDLDRLRAWKDEVVARLTGGLRQLSQQRSVTFIQGMASFVDAHTVSVASGVTDGDAEHQQIKFDHAILATGSRPSHPAPLALDDARVLDSTGALDIQHVPTSLLVIGGGYIGLELGTVYAALGSEVTVVEMTANLLSGVDRDLVRVIARRLNRVMKAIHLETMVTGLTAAADGIAVAFEGPAITDQVQRFDAVLVAVGRVPNSNVPGLDRTKVELDSRGFVQVDPQRRTTEHSIFAIGDVAGEPMLAHKAFREARVAVETIAGRPAAFECKAIPAVVFTDPEVAWCGLTETAAAEAGRSVRVAKFPWGASGRAMTMDRPEGVTKLIFEPDTECLLGVGLVGTGAGELIAEGVVAVEMGATASDLKLSIHPHPTLSETIMEAAEVFFGQATHIHRPRKS